MCAGCCRTRGAPCSCSLGLVGLLALLFATLPTAFLPEEDQGVLMAIMKLPAGASLQRTIDAQEQLEAALRSDTGSVSAVFSIAGRSFSGNGQNTGMSFVLLRDWSERTGGVPVRRCDCGASQPGCQRSIRDANTVVMSPPLIRGLGTSNGFDLELKDVAGVGREVLAGARDQLLELAAQDHRLARCASTASPTSRSST